MACSGIAAAAVDAAPAGAHCGVGGARELLNAGVAPVVRTTFRPARARYAAYAAIGAGIEAIRADALRVIVVDTLARIRTGPFAGTSVTVAGCIRDQVAHVAAATAVQRIRIGVDAKAVGSRIGIAGASAKRSVAKVSARIGNGRAILRTRDATAAAVRALRGRGLTAIARVVVAVSELIVASAEPAHLTGILEHASGLSVRRQITRAALAGTAYGRIGLLVTLADANLLAGRALRRWWDIAKRVGGGVIEQAPRA